MTAKGSALPFKQQLRMVSAFVLLVTIIEVINLFTLGWMHQFGIIPRTVSSLPFILTAPFIHGDLWHYFSNIVPLAIFSLLLLQHGKSRFYAVTVLCILVSGLCVWLFARSANHIGISGLVYGYFGYLVAAGFISREIKLILIAIVVGVSYGGMVFGILPLNAYVSWESHLFGLLTGIACAFLMGKRNTIR